LSSLDSYLDSVMSIQWSPVCCLRELLIANSHGRVTIWTQPSQVSDCWVLSKSNCYVFYYKFLYGHRFKTYLKGSSSISSKL